MNDLPDMVAAVLAGGQGNRLRPVLGKKQKVVAQLAGKPFLFRLLDQLRQAAVKRVVLCTGFRGDEVRSAVGMSFDTMAIQYSEESEPLGTGGALRLALPQLPSDWVLVMNGDSYCDVDLRAFWSWHMDQPTDIVASIVVVPVTNASRYGKIALDTVGTIHSFEEKTPNAGPGLVNGGIYVLSRSALETIQPGRPVSLEREVFPNLVGRGLCGYRAGSRLIDIGTPESYREAESLFKRGADE